MRRSLKERNPTLPNPKPQNPIRQSHQRRRPRGRRNSGVAAATDQAASPQQKGITGKAIDKVKQVAKSAGDIFNRVPCLPPKGGSKKMGSLPHVAAKLASGRAGPDHRVRIVVDCRLRLDLAGIQLSEPARGAAAPAISNRRHHRGQSRPGRRRRAGDDEAAADRGDRHASGYGDLAGRHQRGAAQPRSRRDRQDGRRRRRADSGGRRRSRAGRSAIFAAGQREGGECGQDGEPAAARLPNSATSASSRASR